MTSKLEQRKEYWAGLRECRVVAAKQHSTPETRREFEAYGMEIVRQCFQLAHEEWPDLIPANPIHPPMKWDWSERRTRSWGGWPHGMTIAMRRACLPYPVIEYRSFDTDPVIGTYQTNSARGHLACTVAHEMAHVIQYYIKHKVTNQYRMFGKQMPEPANVRKWCTGGPHGNEFKRIYRLFRTKIINDLPKDFD